MFRQPTHPEAQESSAGHADLAPFPRHPVAQVLYGELARPFGGNIDCNPEFVAKSGFRKPKPHGIPSGIERRGQAESRGSVSIVVPLNVNSACAENANFQSQILSADLEIGRRPKNTLDV